MTSIKPLPCPFCGEAKRIGVHLRKSGRKSGYQVRCLNCLVAQAGCYYGIQEHAVGAWNERNDAGPLRRLINDHAKRSHYERDHWVTCLESNESVRSCVYNPNGESLTLGEICAIINELQDENEELRGNLEHYQLRDE